LITLVSYINFGRSRSLHQSYLAGLDVRARITATLYNYGTANGYASVKFYTICDSRFIDQSIQTVFVPKGQYVTVEADLDISAFLFM